MVINYDGYSGYVGRCSCVALRVHLDASLYIIGTIFEILFGLLIGGGVGIGSFFAYRYLPTPANIEVLFLVLTGAYLFWLVLPLLEYSVNEGLDLFKAGPLPAHTPRIDDEPSLLNSVGYSHAWSVSFAGRCGRRLGIVHSVGPVCAPDNAHLLCPGCWD